MSTKLITLRSEHDASLQTILALLTESLDIFDGDLTKLRLEHPENNEILHKFLAINDRNRVRIVLKDPEPFLRTSPRFFNLLTTFPARMSILKCPQQLQSLNDSFVIVDGKNALIRFHKDNARSRIIINDKDSCIPYSQRFEDILKEGGEPVNATTLGL